MKLRKLSELSKVYIAEMLTKLGLECGYHAWKFHNLKHFLTHRRRRGLTPEALTASDSKEIGAHLRRLVSFISSNQSRWGPKTRILSWIQRWENLISYFQFVSVIKNPNQITKGCFFSESAMCFLDLQISKKKIFQKTILSLKFKFSAILPSRIL